MGAKRRIGGVATSEEILRLKALTDFDQAKGEVGDLGKTIEKAGDAAKGTAGNLQQAAKATDVLSSAEGELSAESKQAAQSLAQVGDVAVETGASGSAAARQYATAIEGVTSAAGQEAAAVRQAGSETVASSEKARSAVESLAAQFRKEAEAIAASGQPLEQVRAQLAAYVAELEKTAAGTSQAFGPNNKAAMESASATIGEVKAKLASVTAEIAKQKSEYPDLGGKGKAALEAIDEAAASVYRGALNAGEAIRKATTQMEETGRIGPKAIGFAAQAVENYRQTVIAARGSIEAAREDEIATLKFLEARLGSVTQRANALTNAAKDNAVRMKESGNQIAGVGLSIQDLTRDLGPAAKGLGDIAGKAGIYAANIEQLKDAFGGLTKGTAGFLGQIALVAAAVYATVKVIDLFAEAYREGNKEIGNGVELLKRYRSEVSAARVMHEANTQAQKANTASSKTLYDAMRAVLKVLETTGDQSVAMKILADRIDEAAKSSTKLSAAERKRAELVSDLLRRGKLLTEEQRDFVKTLADQVKFGRDASGVLNTLISLNLAHEHAVRGSSEKLRDSFSALQSLTREWGLNSQAIRDAISNTQAILDKTDDLTESQRRNYERTLAGLAAVDAARQRSLELEKARVTALTTGEDEATDATLRTARAVQGYLIDLAAIIPKSSEWGGVLSALAGQLKSVTGESVILSETDRGRLEIIAELTARGASLSESQKQLALDLIAAAKAGTETSNALNIVARIHGDLDIATGGTTQKLSDLTEAIGILVRDGWTLNSQAIGIAIAALNAAAEKTDGLDTSQRKLYETLANGKAKIDSLTGTLKTLAEKEQEIVDEMSRASAERSRVLAKEYEDVQRQIQQARDRIASEQGVVTETNNAIKSMEDRQKAQQAAIDATAKNIQSDRQNVGSLGSVATATGGTATAAEEAALKIRAAANGVSVEYQRWLEGANNMKPAGDVAKEVAAKTQDAAKTIVSTWGPAADSTHRVVEQFDILKIRIGEIDGALNPHTAAVNALADAYDRLATSSAKAAGTSGGGVSDTGLEPR